jgi:hypothetical protein
MIEQEILHYSHIVEATFDGWGGWEKWGGNRLRYMRMFGLAGREDGRLVSFGGLFWLSGPRSAPEACVALRPDFLGSSRSRWVHRVAIEVLDAAREIAPVVLARCDPGLVTAPVWLERLGFEPFENGEYWVYAGHSSSGGESRVVRT